jgi:hypothetical protein
VFPGIREENIFEGRKLFPYPQQFPEIAFLSQYPLCTGVANAVKQRLLAEVGEQCPGDNTNLQRAQEGEKNVGHLGEENEKHIPRRETLLLQYVGKTRTFLLKIPEGPPGLFPVRAAPVKCSLAGKAALTLHAGADMSDIVLTVSDKRLFRIHGKSPFHVINRHSLKLQINEGASPG